MGEHLETLQRAIARRRWIPARHPPLSVAVTLVGLEPAHGVSAELIGQRARARATSELLDLVNRRYGNNALYFGAMQQALSARAAPMRIPFSTIPDTAFEEDVSVEKRTGAKAAGGAGELWRQRERQFKVLAENTHRQQARQRPRGNLPEQGKQAKRYGAGGWGSQEDSGAQTQEAASLF